MQLAVWWTWQRFLWSMRPLPRHPGDRDRVLAERAAKVLDRHLREIPTSANYSLDPYLTKAAKVLAEDPSDLAILILAVKRAELILRPHRQAGHLMNALLRDRDPTTLAYSKSVAETVAREAAEEKARRASPTIPPPASGSNLASGTP